MEPTIYRCPAVLPLYLGWIEGVVDIALAYVQKVWYWQSTVLIMCCTAKSNM